MELLFDLSGQPEAVRDGIWEQNFLQAFVAGKVDIMQETPQQGPDGWPYMLVKTSNDPKEPVRNLIHWATERGVGIVINADKQLPDFIFTFGMLWSFRERAMFIAEINKEAALSQTEFKEGQKVVSGEPDKKYLPDYVRKVLRSFFKDQGIENPKFVVLSTDEKNYDLVFSLDSISNPPKEEHQGILEALSWFLPNDYSLVLAPEKGLPKFYDI